MQLLADPRTRSRDRSTQTELLAVQRPGSTPPPRGGIRATMSRYGGSWAWYAMAIALAFAVLAPIVLFYARAFDNGGAAVLALATYPNLGDILLRTLLLAVGSTVIAAVIAVVLAQLVMRVPMRWRGLAAFLPQLPLVIPPVASIIGWVFIFAPTVGYGNFLLRGLPFFSDLSSGPFDVYSMTAIVLITGIDLAGIIFAFVYARLHEISGSLVAAARVTGATAWKSFFTITLPLLRPSLVGAVVVAFLLGLGQFTAPLLLGSSSGLDVLTTEIFHMRERFPIDYSLIAAMGLPLLIIGIVSVLIQRAVIGDQRRYVTQGAGRGITTRDSRWALVAVLFYGFVTVVLPLLALLLVAFSAFWSGDISAITYTTRHVEAVLGDPKVLDAITNSILTALIAAAVVLPLGFIAALAMSGAVKAPKAVRQVFDFLFVAPLAVPRAMLGMAILYVFIQPPFSLYGTFALFVVGYAFVVLPFALRSQLASLVGVHTSLFEAARVSGASQMRTVLDIALPLTKRGMTAALAIMLILLSHDFAVSVMLRSPGNQVMGTILYEFWEGGIYPQVAVMALIMTVVTGVLLALTLWLGGRKALQNI
jgi:iron(III) transport system permease protein